MRKQPLDVEHEATWTITGDVDLEDLTFTSTQQLQAKLWRGAAIVHH